MEKQFVNYEIALKLKELGFDEECLMWYCHENNLTNDQIFRQYKKEDYFCEAPLWQDVEYWFRTKYELKISIYHHPNTFMSEAGGCGWHRWYATLTSCSLCASYKNHNKYLMPCTKKETKLLDTYEEAREEIILKAIKLVKK